MHESTSREQLVRTALSMGIKFPFDADDSTLSSLISSRRQNMPRYTPQRDSGMVKDILYAALVTIVVLSGILIYLIVYVRPSRFCQDTQNKRCVPCPSRAKCESGSAVCEEGFVLVHHNCIVNTSSKLRVAVMLETTQDFLERRVGSYKCNKNDRDWGSRDEIEAMLIAKLNPDIAGFNEAFELALNHLKYSNGFEEKITPRGVIYTSHQSIIPMSCKAKQWLIRRSRWIILVIFIATGSFALWNYRQKRKEKERKTRVLASSLHAQLRSSQNRNASDAAIKEILAQYVRNPEEYWPGVKLALMKFEDLRGRF